MSFMAYAKGVASPAVGRPVGTTNNPCLEFSPDGFYYCTLDKGHGKGLFASVHVAHDPANLSVELAEWYSGDKSISYWDFVPGAGILRVTPAPITRKISLPHAYAPIPASASAGTPVTGGATPPVAATPKPPLQPGPSVAPIPQPKRVNRPTVYDPIDEWDLLPDEE